MSGFSMVLLRATNGVAPRPEWAEPVVAMFDSCRLLELWSEHFGVDAEAWYGVVDESGTLVELRRDEFGPLRAGVAAGGMSLQSVHRNAMRWEGAKSNGSVTMTYLWNYEKETGSWLDVWGGLSFDASDRALNRAGSMPAQWWGAAAELLVEGAVAFDAWYGSGLFHLQKDLMPHGRVYWQASFPRWHEGEVDWLPGLAPVFLVSPTMLAPMGGLEGLAGAPVHEVLPVAYRDGRVGAVVRIGSDDEDMVRRLGEAYDFFEPFFRDPPGPHDIWPAGGARNAFRPGELTELDG